MFLEFLKDVSEKMAVKNEIELESIKAFRRGLILHLITATGILRNSFKNDVRRKMYKIQASLIIEKLLDKADAGSLKNSDITWGIKQLHKRADCSIGLAQKGVNVVLKYYCVAKGDKSAIYLLKQLDCPVDKTIIYDILNKRNEKSYKLIRLDKKKYDKLQKAIDDTVDKSTGRKKYKYRVMADMKYEEKYLNRAGIEAR
jgi:hypothetical protein